MPVTTPVPRSDDPSAAGEEAASSSPDEGHIDNLLRSLTASWRPVSIVVERRGEHRQPCDLPAVLAPLDRRLGRIIAGAPLDVRVQDVSPHGVGITHLAPMAHRMALLEFETAADGPVRLVVRLKWCRFKRADLYESGGQILRVLRPGEEPA